MLHSCEFLKEWMMKQMLKWWNISSGLYQLQIRMMEQKNYQHPYLTLQLCYIAFPWTRACVYSLHCFLQCSAVCVFVSPNSDVSSSLRPSVTPACQASVDERKETNWCSWETEVKYCPPVSNWYIWECKKEQEFHISLWAYEAVARPSVKDAVNSLYS